MGFEQLEIEQIVGRLYLVILEKEKQIAALTESLGPKLPMPFPLPQEGRK